MCIVGGVFAGALPYDPNHEHITTIHHENFRDAVLQGDNMWVVEYYAPWCGHCKSFAPEYEKAAKALDGIVKFGAVNADDKNAGGVAAAFKVEGYPTIHLFPSDLVEHEGEGGGEGSYTKVPIAFQGERSANTLVKWVLSQMPTKHIRKITDEDSEKAFLAEFADDNLPKVLLFSNKKIIAPLYISLSLDFKYRALFGFVPGDESASEIREKYKVTSFPTIIVIGEDDEFHTYEGDVAKGPLADFMKAHALPAASRNTMMAKVLQEEALAKKREKDQKRVLNAPKPQLINTTDQWKKLCIQRVVGLCAIALLDPSDSGFANQLQALQDVAKLLPAKVSSLSVQIVIIDGPTNFEIANYFENSNGYPSMVFAQPKRGRYINLIGSFTRDSIVSFVENKVVSAPGKSYEESKIPTFIEPMGGDE
jgi:protein disulfide-isomerase A6